LTTSVLGSKYKAAKLIMKENVERGLFKNVGNEDDFEKGLSSFIYQKRQQNCGKKIKSLMTRKGCRMREILLKMKAGN